METGASVAHSVAHKVLTHIHEVYAALRGRSIKSARLDAEMLRRVGTILSVGSFPLESSVFTTSWAVV